MTSQTLARKGTGFEFHLPFEENIARIIFDAQRLSEYAIRRRETICLDDLVHWAQDANSLGLDSITAACVFGVEDRIKGLPGIRIRHPDHFCFHGYKRRLLRTKEIRREAWRRVRQYNTLVLISNGSRFVEAAAQLRAGISPFVGDTTQEHRQYRGREVILVANRPADMPHPQWESRARNWVPLTHAVVASRRLQRHAASA